MVWGGNCSWWPVLGVLGICSVPVRLAAGWQMRRYRSTSVPVSVAAYSNATARACHGRHRVRPSSPAG
ncbi:hypothetical protein [Nocardia aurantiaca]|uniref:Uncharacterized protein n=1 Tax=Nocardia aurantiaca TaxID=2675850 RepID=A0A6I3KU94_9NOCA|nr:hypothetical protein [Nocardia aurantiaca]MTE12616.1 hypothetical protein [Nocardia aurantiaca]